MSMFFKTLAKKLYVLLGSFLFAYIIYVRLILHRLPVQVGENVSLLKLVMYFCLSITFIYLFIKAIKNFLEIEEEISTLGKILNYFPMFFHKSLIEFYQSLKGKLIKHFDIGQWHESLGIWFVKVFNTKSKIWCLVLFMDFLPKLILVFVLCIDVLFFQSVSLMMLLKMIGLMITMDFLKVSFN